VRGLAELVSVLVRHDVRFIIVGGMAGALQGAPVNTLDLDIVYARDPENVERLLRALKSVDARFRDDARHLEPNESHLLSKGHKLLITSHGHLDVLGAIEEDSGYEERHRRIRSTRACGPEGACSELGTPDSREGKACAAEGSTDATDPSRDLGRTPQDVGVLEVAVSLEQCPRFRPMAYAGGPVPKTARHWIQSHSERNSSSAMPSAVIV
jgi:hypothetical protein